jgi:hypothetical protein
VNILGAIYPQLRTGMMAIFAALTLLALLAFLIQRRKGPVSMPSNILALFLIALAIIPLDIVFFNGQLYDRGIMYIVLVAPIVFVPLLMGKKHRYARPLLGSSSPWWSSPAPRRCSIRKRCTSPIAGASPPPTTCRSWTQMGRWRILSRRRVERERGELQPRQDGLPVESEPELVVSWMGSGIFLFDDTTEMWYTQWGIQEVYVYYSSAARRITRCTTTVCIGPCTWRGKRMRIGLVNLITKTADVQADASVMRTQGLRRRRTPTSTSWRPGGGW